MKDQTVFRRITFICLIVMGTQFDPNMRIVFLSARKELEDYYAPLR